MRHRVSGRKFSLPSDQRKALLKSLVRALFINDKIMTTETRAKEARVIAEKLITTARRNDIHSRRLVRQFLDSSVPEFGVDEKSHKPAQNPNYIIPRLFEQIAPRYANRPGGYTRITHIGARRGDGAPMVMLELVEGEAVIAPAGAGTAAATKAKPRGIFGRRK
jgi:large subunit ribosomal protein L17